MYVESVKVVKFGGTSLSDAGQFKKVRDIIISDESRRYIVPSAPGKRSNGDEKITDLLYSCYDAASKGRDIENIFSKITDRFNNIVAGLGLDLSLEKEYETIKYALLHKAGRDYTASRGEYLSGLVLAKYLGYDFIDAAEVIFFNDNGTFDAERTDEMLSERLLKHKTAVVPGFYGSMPNDTIKTFSRGGSDITGSILARSAQADLYENWTDVSGFLMADPRIVNKPRVIDIITYRELRELSYMGATVLHEESIFPVRFAGIPINIRNTNDPAASGTMIVSQTSSRSKHVITGIAGRKGFSVITIEKDMMNSELGFGRRVLEVLEKNSVSFEHLPSGIDTMCVVVATSALEKCREMIVNGICSTTEPESVYIEDGLALIAIVGRGMIRTKGTAARTLTAVAKRGINIRMIDQGSSELNIIIGIDDNDLEESMRAIYAEFCN